VSSVDDDCRKIRTLKASSMVHFISQDETYVMVGRLLPLVPLSHPRIASSQR